jgi:excisionase family DNA binding protein
MTQAQIIHGDEVGPEAKQHIRERFHRISHVAETLDMSISTIRRLIRDGQLDSIRIGSLVRVPASSLEAFLKAGKQHSRRRGKK